MSARMRPLDIDATIVGPVIELRYSNHVEAYRQLSLLREWLKQRDELLAALQSLVDALDKTNWSSWQTTARFDPSLNDARELIFKVKGGAA